MKLSLFVLTLLMVGFQNCGGPNGLESGLQSESSQINSLSLAQQETIHLMPQITQRLDQETGQSNGVNAPQVTSINLNVLDQSVQNLIATRIYGPFEGIYSHPMVFENLQNFQHFGFYIEKSTLSGSELGVEVDDQLVDILKIPVTTDGNSVTVQTMFWVKLKKGSRKIQLKILNHVGVVRILDYVITQKTPEDLEKNCDLEAQSYCRIFAFSQSHLN